MNLKKKKIVEKRRVACISSDPVFLQKIMDAIDESVAILFPIKAEREFLELINVEGESQTLDDVILSSDFLEDTELVTFVRSIPRDIIIFFIHQRPVNGFYLDKIVSEDIEFASVEDLSTKYYVGQTALETEGEQVLKPKKKKVKMPKLQLKSLTLKKKANSEKEDVEFESFEESKSVDSNVDEAQDEETFVEKDRVIRKKINIGLPGKRENFVTPEKERVIRKLKVVEPKVVIKKSTHTKLKRTVETHQKIAVIGTGQAGQTVCALALAFVFAEKNKKVGLLDMGQGSVTGLSKLCGVSSDECGLDQLMQGVYDPYEVNKSGNLHLFTSAYAYDYEDAVMRAGLENLSAVTDCVIVDMSFSKKDIVKGCDKMLFIIDSEPQRLDNQMDQLKAVSEIFPRPITILLNRHTKSCISRRDVRRKIYEALSRYINDIHICPFDERDLDYVRSHVHKGIDGHGFYNLKKVMKEIVKK